MNCEIKRHHWSEERGVRFCCGWRSEFWLSNRKILNQSINQSVIRAINDCNGLREVWVSCPALQFILLVLYLSFGDLIVFWFHLNLGCRWEEIIEGDSTRQMERRGQQYYRGWWPQDQREQASLQEKQVLLT